MKMLLAMINLDDAHSVIHHLMKSGFSVTSLATCSGLLHPGNVTILIGLGQLRLEEAMQIIRKYSNTRKQEIPTTTNLGIGFHPTMPVEATVGGATAFVLGVQKFKKL